MDKLDFKKVDKAFYGGKQGRWDRITLPQMTFLAIDGQGDPNGPGYAAALGVLYPLAYGVKFACKSEGADYVVPPLEALWWAEDPAAFVAGNRAAWQWRAMLRMPDRVSDEIVEEVRESVRVKLLKKGVDIEPLAQAARRVFEEGACLQTLHVGPYTAEAPVLADLHERVMPEAGLAFNGAHHEIYLSDPRRVAPEKLRTILRQPVKSTG
ncbi:GyrI-like domain-containing protein [Shimia sp. FJ5]|uniref:GyrI-like domain-containing protein n=1 Tax=Shimia sp. FJ5 TaxID=3079054 RepID=UPI002636EE45|nr:GyrI-like domain-containing protein [Shimia sp. FJ5]MDV4144930.1 GyrI-like domain-containing protein [Shimia sp. FJ5]